MYHSFALEVIRKLDSCPTPDCETSLLSRELGTINKRAQTIHIDAKPTSCTEMLQSKLV
jgi:hypothetical protein